MLKAVNERLLESIMRLSPQIRSQSFREHSGYRERHEFGLHDGNHGDYREHNRRHGELREYAGYRERHDFGLHRGHHRDYRERNKRHEELRNTAWRETLFARERVLGVLLGCETGLRQKDIAEKIRVNPSSMSELIDKLENDGYVFRMVNPSDKRATLIILTEKGKARACELQDSRDEQLNSMFGNLTNEEKEALIHLLDKMIGERDKPDMDRENYN